MRTWHCFDIFVNRLLHVAIGSSSLPLDFCASHVVFCLGEISIRSNYLDLRFDCLFVFLMNVRVFMLVLLRRWRFLFMRKWKGTASILVVDAYYKTRHAGVKRCHFFHGCLLECWVGLRVVGVKQTFVHEVPHKRVCFAVAVFVSFHRRSWVFLSVMLLLSLDGPQDLLQLHTFLTWAFAVKKLDTEWIMLLTCAFHFEIGLIYYFGDLVGNLTCWWFFSC